MRNIKIRTLSLFLIASLTAVGIIFVASMAFMQWRISSGNDIWQAHQDSSSPKSQAVDLLITQMGFGNMIHQYKNLILRKEKKRIEKVKTAATTALAALKQYEATGTNPEEDRAIADIRKTIEAYVHKTNTVNVMVSMNSNATKIDKKVKIDDTPAVAGIETLKAEIQSGKSNADSPPTKTQILSALRKAIGFGGMIHQFKNFVLRQDTPRIGEIQGKITDARAAIDQYLARSPNDAERKALQDIRGVIDAYAVSVNTIIRLAEAGKTPEEIDGEVSIDDRPAMEGMDVLINEIAAFNLREQEAMNETFASISQTAMVVIVIAVASMLILSAFAYWMMSTRITRPIQNLTETMAELAAGNVDIKIPESESRTEVGEMARAIQVFRDNKIKADELTAEQERHREEQVRHARRIEELNRDFDAAVSGIVETVSSAAASLQGSAESMSANADETDNQADIVSRAATSAEENVNTVASAAEQLSASIDEITMQVAKSSETSQAAVSSTRETSLQIKELAQVANSISEVVNLITDIADQTNLLALNATIEAARAGEAGKGFAVVASEVKNLANQTSKATDEISMQVSAIQSATVKSVSSIEGITKIIEELNQSASVISIAVDQQGSATREIAKSIQHAAEGTQAVSGSIGNVATAAGEAGRTSKSVLDAAKNLTEQNETLKVIVNNFLREVSAA